jgi:hypothetical protein
MKAVLLALGLTLWAPYQCGTEPNERPREDTAPAALWELSEKFEAEGNAAARESTLNQLVEKYPSSRQAEKARLALGLPSRAKNDRIQPPDHKDEEEESGGEKPDKADKAESDEENPESGDE